MFKRTGENEFRGYVGSGRESLYKSNDYIVARFYGHQGFCTMYFSVERHHPKVYDPKIGTYTLDPEVLGRGATHDSYSMRIGDDASAESALLGALIDYIARGDLVGKGACDAVYTLMYMLEIKPQSEWLAEAAPRYLKLFSDAA